MKFVGRLHKHRNDCWCDALALATGKDYDEVYASLTPWVDSSGSLYADISTALLRSYGYTMIRAEDLTVRDALDLYNHYDNHIVIVLNETEDSDHMVYVHHGKIYDQKIRDYDRKFFESKVTYIYYKSVDKNWKHK